MLAKLCRRKKHSFFYDNDGRCKVMIEIVKYSTKQYAMIWPQKEHPFKIYYISLYPPHFSHCLTFHFYYDE